MRPRFFALFGCSDPRHRERVAHRIASKFPVAYSFGDVSLFLETSTPHMLLPQSGGAVIGHLIDRATNTRLTAISSSRDLAISSSRGRHLIDSCYGSYAAIWVHSPDMVSVLRDPSAGLPVYVSRSRDATYVFSDIRTAVELCLLPVRIDWDMMAHSLLYEQLNTRSTAISGLEEVLPGDRMDCAGTSSFEPLWKPWTFHCRGVGLSTLSRDAQSIAEAVDASVAGWAGCFDQIHLELSGGLDSSILAASLAATDTKWSCATLATVGEGDEHHYARMVANHLGKELQTVDASGAEADPMVPLAILTPRPRGMRVLATLDAAFQTAFDATGAGAILNGGGGDNVFAYTRSTAPIVDAWRAGGAALARSVARDLATLSRTPLGSVYGALARRMLTTPFGRPWPADRTFLASSVRLSPRTHPWMQMPRGTGPGMRSHIGSIIRIHPFIDCVERQASRTMIFPLLSQPVMEACLAVPSWRWVEGGHNRALARQAFADRLPESILYRRSKGGVDAHVVAAIERRRPDIRALLLDGCLARQGLLDRRRLEIGLATPFKDRTSQHTRIVQLVDAELWALEANRLGESIPFCP